MQYRSLPGLIPYEEARRLQLELVDLRARGEIPDTILFLEHEPVITRGRGLQWTGEKRAPMPLGPLPEGVAFAESERGGDLTYHGPGQLVIYPIFKITDVGAYLRGLEKSLIAFLGSYGLNARTIENATGAWVGDRKVASIGVAVRKWVTYHGIAINFTNDLSPFFAISPCGFQPEVMARMQDLVQLPDSWRADAEARWTSVAAIEVPVSRTAATSASLQA